LYSPQYSVLQGRNMNLQYLRVQTWRFTAI